jgi:hypothetical protein
MGNSEREREDGMEDTLLVRRLGLSDHLICYTAVKNVVFDDRTTVDES